MKKIILSVVFAGFGLCAFAQEEAAATVAVPAQAEAATVSEFKGGANRFGLELGLNLSGGASTISGGRLMAIYSLSDSWAVRCGLGLNVTKEFENDEAEATVAGITASTAEKEVTKKTSFAVLPGIQYNFDGTDRLEPFVGLGLQIGSAKSKIETYEESKFSPDNTNGSTYEFERKETQLNFGANVFTGFDFYVAKDLYLGAELNFGFLTYATPHVTTKTTDSTADPKTTETDNLNDEGIKDHKDRATGFSFTPSGAIRLGWKF